MVHFAVDDHEVWMCTELKDGKSWFLPFNKGYQEGAGNPPNPAGLATDYLWKQILQPLSLTNIIENYAQIVEEVDRKGRKKRRQLFPRYHQLDLVRKLLAHAAANGIGHRYLAEHSAGSGKSNSIAWLGHQLVELKTGASPSPTGVGEGGRRPGEGRQGETNSSGAAMFDSIIVVTDRRVLDRQIRENIRQFA